MMVLRLAAATRRNHALEHATIAVLVERLGLGLRLLGRATPHGFYIHGDVPTEVVKAAAEEGLARLEAGEVELAVSPFCGTNLVVAGAMAALATFVALGRKRQVGRLPQAMVAAMGAVILAQPLGRVVQRHLTTSANIGNVRIASVSRRGKGPRTVHRVEVR